MTARWPSLSPLILSLALFTAIAWMALSSGAYIGKLGGETYVARCLLYGVAFERYARGVSPHRHGWRPIDYVNWRGRWGLQYDSLVVGAARSDRLYVSFPWLLLFPILPGAIWLVLAVRRPRRRVIGVCPGCEYDIRATPQRCPECGVVLRPPSALDRVLAVEVRWLWNRLRRRRMPPGEVGASVETQRVTDAPAVPPPPPQGGGGT